MLANRNHDLAHEAAPAYIPGVTTRSLGQYCGLARALEIVGERWALLLVRDLLVGPRRFSDLRRGLPRIPTNILTGRLRELEDAGIVERRLLPRPETGVAYALTDFGRDLEPALLALGRWGARTLGDPRPGEVVTVDSLVVALRTAFRPERAAGVHLGVELRFGALTLHARVDDGALAAAPGPLADADLVIEAGPSLRALLDGTLRPAAALRRGDVRLTGDRALLDRFVVLFSLAPAVA